MCKVLSKFECNWVKPFFRSRGLHWLPGTWKNVPGFIGLLPGFKKGLSVDGSGRNAAVSLNPSGLKKKQQRYFKICIFYILSIYNVGLFYLRDLQASSKRCHVKVNKQKNIISQ